MGTKKELRLTAQNLKVLGLLISRGDEEISGAEIAKATGLASGTLYPILLRLEQAKWAKSRWEAGDPSELKRPRRRLYHITAEGTRQAQAALRELSFPIGEVAWQH
jgi:PadR family transcriptional regulator, regulatory protein PadR